MLAAIICLHYLKSLNWLDLILAVITIAGLFGYAFTLNYLLLIVGVAAFALLTVWQRRKQKVGEPTAMESGSA